MLCYGFKSNQKFNGKAEGKTLCPGDVIQSNDVDRINALVGRGFCVIVALDSTPPAAITTNPTPTDEEASVTVDFRGYRYPLETVKAALGVIGVKVAHNAKEKGREQRLIHTSPMNRRRHSPRLSTTGANPKRITSKLWILQFLRH